MSRNSLLLKSSKESSHSALHAHLTSQAMFFYIPPISAPPPQGRESRPSVGPSKQQKGEGDTLGSGEDCGKQRCVPYLKGTVK